MRNAILSLIICLAVLAAAELGLRQTLFKHVSYSNSESIDRQIRERNAENGWNMIFIGDSEVHWGINPAVIDSAFKQHGIAAKSFNHAFDGFGASWWVHMLPPLLEHPSLQDVQVVALGVQMTSTHSAVRVSGDDCGALQKPVLTSPFAKDLGVDFLCRDATWDSALGKNIFSALWTVRYASAVRSLLLPEFMRSEGALRFNSSKNGEPYRGYEPHRSIAEDKANFPAEFARWKAQYKPERDFVPLPPQEWINLTAPGGFFDTFNNVVKKSGRKLVLFALPTNPLLIDTMQRRADYRRNSQLLSQWAQSRNVIFVDPGIQDVANPDIYFSDIRHLSGTGASIYSKNLGQLLAKAKVLASAPSHPDQLRKSE